MTVQEVIELLKLEPQNAEIQIDTIDGTFKITGTSSVFKDKIKITLHLFRHRKDILMGPVVPIMDYKVSEFKERLRYTVSKIVCEIPKDEAALEKLYRSLLPEQQWTLTQVLYGEIQQLLQAVKEAK